MLRIVHKAIAITSANCGYVIGWFRGHIRKGRDVTQVAIAAQTSAVAQSHWAVLSTAAHCLTEGSHSCLLRARRSSQQQAGRQAARARHVIGEMSGLVSVDYEVFGEVQGVFFRKYTEQEAKKLGLVGWVRNTRQDTVEGQIQGPEEAVEKMKNWLRTTGSPMSRIDKATFNNEHAVSALEFSSFTTRY